MNNETTLNHHGETSETSTQRKSSAVTLTESSGQALAQIAGSGGNEDFRAALKAQIGRLESVLLETLASSPGAISEFELMRQLSEPPCELLSAAARRSSLGLFQSHFLLFHTLYGIRLKAVPDLCIHPLHIGDITSNPAGETQGGLPPAVCLAHMNGSGAALASYYLDLDNLYSTSAKDVDALMTGFWKLFRLAETGQD